MTEYMSFEQIKAARRSPDRWMSPADCIGFFWDEPGEMTIEIPALPPSKNRWDRLPSTKKPLPAKVLQAMRRRAWYDPWHQWFADQYLVFGDRATFGDSPVDVEIEFHFPDQRNRDTVQNYAGFPPLMDALVRCGIIKDDGRKWCRLTVKPDAVIDGRRLTVVRIRKLSKQLRG